MEPEERRRHHQRQPTQHIRHQSQSSSPHSQQSRVPHQQIPPTAIMGSSLAMIGLHNSPLRHGSIQEMQLSPQQRRGHSDVRIVSPSQYYQSSYESAGSRVPQPYQAFTPISQDNFQQYTQPLVSAGEQIKHARDGGSNWQDPNMYMVPRDYTTQQQQQHQHHVRRFQTRPRKSAQVIRRSGLTSYPLSPQTDNAHGTPPSALTAEQFPGPREKYNALIRRTFQHLRANQLYHAKVGLIFMTNVLLSNVEVLGMCLTHTLDYCNTDWSRRFSYG